MEEQTTTIMITAQRSDIAEIFFPLTDNQNRPDVKELEHFKKQTT